MREASTRIYGIIARKAPVAVLFRRGPSDFVQMLKWNLTDDTFEHGQWLNGRIYERRADLSPSGKLVIYFAAKYKGPMTSWTAISKPPYLTAIALWEGMGAWGGGGLFDDETHVQLNHSITRMRISDTFKLPEGVKIVPCGENSGSGEDSPIMDMRMERDGWTQTQSGEECFAFDLFGQKDNLSELEALQEQFGFLEGGKIWAEKFFKEKAEAKAKRQEERKNKKYDMFMTLDPPDIHVKADGDCILEMTTFGFHETNGPPWVQEYRVLAKDGEEIFNLGKTDWADWDHNGDLLFSQNGCVFRSKRENLSKPKQLIDLTGSKFSPVSAPDEFRSW